MDVYKISYLKAEVTKLACLPLNPFTPQPFFQPSAKVFFFCCFYAGEIYQETFFLGGGGQKTLNFFSYISEKTENQVRNEIFRQMSLTLT